MIVFPNCKINLGLNIIRRRGDGYHDLETVFYPLAFHDAVEVVELDNDDPKNKDGSFGKFSTTGEIIEGKPEHNLCIKAYNLLKNKHPLMPAVRMHLHKAIPPGSGLGGGSSDGAFTLRLLNQKFALELTIEQLLDHALQLGSDCPFFIINKPCFASGRGEFLEHITVDLSDYKIAVVIPPIHVSTSEAFSLIKPIQRSKAIKAVVQQPITTWAAELINDFEDSVFSIHPEIKKIKDELYKAGAIYASMTGTGSTVYGIFQKNHAIELRLPEKYIVKELIGKLQ